VRRLEPVLKPDRHPRAPALPGSGPGTACARVNRSAFAALLATLLAVPPLAAATPQPDSAKPSLTADFSQHIEAEAMSPRPGARPDLPSAWQVNGFEKTSEGAAWSLRASLSPDTPALATRTLHVEPEWRGDIIRLHASFTGVAVTSADGKQTVNPYLLNELHASPSIAVAQYDGDGELIIRVSSRRILGDAQAQTLVADTVIREDTERVRFEVRARRLSGTVTFSDLGWSLETLEPALEFAEVTFAENSHGSLYIRDAAGPLPYTIYYGNNQFGQDPLIVSEMSKASASGSAAIVSFNLYLPNIATVSQTREIMDRFLAEAAEGKYFLIRLWLGPGSEWFRKHPGAQVTHEDGTQHEIAVPSSDEWMDEAVEQTRQLLKIIAASPYRGQFIGITPLYHLTGEWAMWGMDRPSGFDPVTGAAYRDWLESKYGSIDALNRSWDTAHAGFASIEVPGSQARVETGLGAFLPFDRANRLRDWQRFYNGQMAAAMETYAQRVDALTPTPLIFGYFYGYTFEHAYRNWPHNTGHYALRHLLTAPSIDFAGSPYSYNFSSRFFGLPIEMHGPIDSFGLHGQAAFIEEDTYTFLAKDPDENLHAPGFHHRTVDLEKTLAALKRNLGYAIARNLLLNWQNLLSDGRFDHPDIWEQYAAYIPWWRGFQQRRKPYSPEIALVVDETAMEWFAAGGKAEPIYRRWFFTLRSALARLDVRSGVYLQSDLDKIPESVRVLVLLSPYRLTRADHEILRERWARDGRIFVSCYAPDISRLTGDAAVYSFLGMKLEAYESPNSGEAISVDGGLWAGLEPANISPATDFSNDYFHPGATFRPVNPWLSVESPEATALAHYKDAPGRAAIAMQRHSDWTHIFLGAHLISVPHWRRIAADAGCHRYLDDLSLAWDEPDFLQATDGFIMLQSSRDGKRTIRLPREAASVSLLNEDGLHPLGENVRSVTIDTQRGVPEFIAYE